MFTTAPQESQLQRCIPQAGVTPSIAPLACWLLSVPSSNSLLSLAPPLPCPFSPSSLAELLLTPSSLAVCVSDFSLPASAPLHRGALWPPPPTAPSFFFLSFLSDYLCPWSSFSHGSTSFLFCQDPHPCVPIPSSGSEVALPVASHQQAVKTPGPHNLKGRIDDKINS